MTCSVEVEASSGAIVNVERTAVCVLEVRWLSNTVIGFGDVNVGITVRLVVVTGVSASIVEKEMPPDSDVVSVTSNVI